jgi:hypothetical protein
MLGCEATYNEFDVQDTLQTPNAFSRLVACIRYKKTGCRLIQVSIVVAHNGKHRRQRFRLVHDEQHGSLESLVAVKYRLSIRP